MQESETKTHAVDAGSASPAKQITGAGTDARFENASDAAGVYDAMQTRCKEFSEMDNSIDRQAGAMTPDVDVLWQGDVGVILLSKAAYAAISGKLKVMGNGASHVQVAVGEGIGSRHTVSTQEATTYARTGAGALDGPVVVSDKPWTLCHPKHRNVTFGPGEYAITYQRQYAEELRRAAD